MNKLVVIGSLGSEKCYLNVTVEEAKKRYYISEGPNAWPSFCYEFEFEDEFDAYAVYAKDGEDTYYEDL